MVFRNSKYKYNSWKHPRVERNYLFLINKYSIFTIRNLIAGIFIIITIPFSIHILDGLLENNVILKRRFEEKKLKQISADFLIYSYSEEFKNEINELSYI